MKAFINSIVFASLAACTVAPAQAGMWDTVKNAASSIHKNAKSGAKTIGNFLTQPKNLLGLGLLTISTLLAKEAIRHTKVDAISHYVTNNLGFLASVSKLSFPEYSLEDEFARLHNHNQTPPLAEKTKHLFVSAVLFGIAGIYNISR